MSTNTYHSSEIRGPAESHYHIKDINQRYTSNNISKVQSCSPNNMVELRMTKTSKSLRQLTLSLQNLEVETPKKQNYLNK